MSILLYTHPLCSDCQAFKAWIDEQDIEYTAIDISTDPQAKADLEAGVGKAGVPTVVVDGEWRLAYQSGKPFDEAFARQVIGLDS